VARISKIMDKSPLILGKESMISEAARLMANKPHGCVIITENRKPIGIITELDIIKAMASKKASLRAKVTEVMSSSVTVVEQSSKLEKTNKIIDTKGFRRYPVVDKEGNLTGLVTENDIVHTINDQIRFHRNLQNMILIVFVAFEFFVFFFYRHLSSYIKF